MPQSLAQIYVHIVFSTKDRKPWLHDGHLCDQLYATMAVGLGPSRWDSSKPVDLYPGQQQGS